MPKHNARGRTPALDETEELEELDSTVSDETDEDEDDAGWMTQRDADDLWDSTDDEDEEDAPLDDVDANTRGDIDRDDVGAPESCLDCDGTGEVPTTGERCLACDGRGFREGDESVSLSEPERGIPAAAGELRVIYVSRAIVHPDPEQPRQSIDDELKASIARHGILQPLTVRPHPELLTEWMIVDGGRRFAASEGILEQLPVIPRTDLDDLRRRMTQLVANTGKALTPIEEAHAFREILEQTGGTVQELADALGRPRSTVGDRLLLLELGAWADAVAAGEVPVSHVVRAVGPLRAVPAEFHAEALESIRQDYRFTRDAKGGADGFSYHDFENLVRNAYKRFMYPLARKARAARNPAFNTKHHDAECSCGGIKFDFGTYEGVRLSCGNPDWWRPLHRKGLQEARAKATTSAKDKPAAVKRTVILPDSIPTKRIGEYESAPKGVTVLTGDTGCWSAREGLDCRAFVIDEKKLVRVVRGARTYVGTTDAAAVKKAKEAFEAAVQAELVSLYEKLAVGIRQSVKRYRVEGEGVVHLLTALNLSNYQGAPIADTLHALGHELPAHVERDRWDRNQKALEWALKQDDIDVAELASAVATVLGEGLKAPGEATATLTAKLVAQLEKQPSPWHPSKAPKPAAKKSAPAAAKSAAKKEPRSRAERSVTAAKSAKGRMQRDPMFMRDQQPDAALAAIVGNTPMPRTEITKKLWAYIKKHGLQDAKERRMIRADEKLRAVFGKEKVSMFEMTKLVNDHFTTEK